MATTRDESGELCLGGLRLSSLARDPSIGTPSYVYDLDAIADGARTLQAAFEGAPHLVAFAVKANAAGPIVRRLAAEGCGADVVSGGELRVALACGVRPDAIVFSGVGKTDDEIDLALATGIRALQVESIEEIGRVGARARARGVVAPIGLRINPALDVGAIDTHAHVATGHDEAKFGVPRGDVADAFRVARETGGVRLLGLTCHVGSQLKAVEPYAAAARVLAGLALDLRAQGVHVKYIDPGGGFGIDYGDGCPVTPADFVRAARAVLVEAGLGALDQDCEPGRSMVAAHGVLLARVLQTKEERRPAPGQAPRRWAILDAGMNDLLRPALYQARHRVVGLSRGGDATVPYRVVGPVCESSDDFGAHPLPAPAPDFVALLDAGAYGYAMASRYNGRPLPAEVFVAGGRVVAVHERKGVDDWVADRVGGAAPAR